MASSGNGMLTKFQCTTPRVKGQSQFSQEDDAVTNPGFRPLSVACGVSEISNIHSCLMKYSPGSVCGLQVLPSTRSDLGFSPASTGSVLHRVHPGFCVRGVSASYLIRRWRVVFGIYLYTPAPLVPSQSPYVCRDFVRGGHEILSW